MRRGGAGTGIATGRAACSPPVRSAPGPREVGDARAVPPPPPLLDGPCRPALGRRGRRAARASFAVRRTRAQEGVLAETVPAGELPDGPPREAARLVVCVLPPAHGREAHPDLGRELLLAHAQALSQETDAPCVVIHLHVSSDVGEGHSDAIDSPTGTLT